MILFCFVFFFFFVILSNDVFSHVWRTKPTLQKSPKIWVNVNEKPICRGHVLCQLTDRVIDLVSLIAFVAFPILVPPSFSVIKFVGDKEHIASCEKIGLQGPQVDLVECEGVNIGSLQYITVHLGNRKVGNGNPLWCKTGVFIVFLRDEATHGKKLIQHPGQHVKQPVRLHNSQRRWWLRRTLD